MQSRLFSVLIAIVCVLAFQVYSLIALEMNVYVVTEGQDTNSTIPKLVKHFDELKHLNEVKPKFDFNFSKEYSGDGGGVYEFPGSY